MAERARTRRPVLLAVLAAGVALVAVVATLLVVSGAAGRGSADDFVTRDGRALRIDGSRFRFVGFNLYDAAASDIYACSPSTRLDDAGLDDAMRAVRDAGGTVVRFWAYQTYTAGGTDFSGVDRVLRAARAHGLRVLPVLEDGPGDCSTGGGGVPLDRVEDGTWYSRGYRSPLGTATVSYRRYVEIVTRHYRDDPTVLAWSLVNEAETDERDSEGRSVLVDFARDVAAVAHAADPRHLVTLGTQANGAVGASGADFAAIYALPGMDLTEVHDWASYGSDDQAMPGAPAGGGLPDPDQCRATDARIACSFALARQLGKPIVVGEAGIAATDAAARARRARQLATKIAADFDAGASGYLVWQLNRTNTDGYGVAIPDEETGDGGSQDRAAEDPVYAVLRAAADRWASGP